MEYNLLQKYYDKQCDLFINGKISFSVFQMLEEKYERNKKLFTINLN